MVTGTVNTDSIDDKSVGETGKDLISAVVEMTYNIERKTWGTIDGVVQHRLPAEIASKEYVVQVATTVDARMTAETLDGISKTAKEVKQTSFA